MLSLAEKAGRLKTGTFLVEEAVRSGGAALVVIAEDAEKNTRKTLEDKCRTYHVPVRYYGTKDGLGHASGKGFRSCAAIMDAGFGTNITRLIDELQKERGGDGENKNQ